LLLLEFTRKNTNASFYSYTYNNLSITVWYYVNNLSWIYKVVVHIMGDKITENKTAFTVGLQCFL
jgi:hypothetical protein